MLIGELSKKTDLSRDTIRFYEKEGLISIGRKERRFNNYKEYSDGTLDRLLSIKRIKGFGFTLKETAEMLELIESKSASCSNVAQKINEKVSDIELKIQELLNLRAMMIKSVEACTTCCNPDSPDENCAMITTDEINVGN